ncbi:MAG: glycoside hydrolase family 3 C-terminal domain-containing protein [Bacteroides sp.]|nr:glycoside hydrolase family 3 C-terminal domain-containing protein [Eubacterium sp.]MCM1417425.1 glycoside hydrolase family 3 C-terminal domain-containing protein [Roseburia sp.]MCM1461604.1 glycoside hydrolase family 3 C-terminal domain-containing protein [Bacteroides sp.]
MRKKEIEKILEKMTIKEKAGLLSGLDGWNTKPVKRLGIPSIMMTDGPHGLRKQREGNDLGIGNSVPATCFPTASLLACSWDKALAEKQGRAIGEEALDQNVKIVLGPGNNIKRSPLCGRNFEYFSEDPFLSGHMAAGLIEGIQSKGVGTSLKHFAANSQETDRLVINERISERALREIYLASYEIPIKEAKPTTVMCAYNRINGEYCSQSKWLLTDILRKEWGFRGVVISDWGAVDNRPQGVYAGLDLEMPSSGGINDKEIVKAHKGEKTALKPTDKGFSGKLSEKQIDACAGRMLDLVLSLDKKEGGKKCDYEAHSDLAAEIARECMVLLKNDGGLLPLAKGIKLAVIGEMAEDPRYQGSGSSRVNSHKVIKPLDELKKFAKVTYAKGYSLERDDDRSRIDEAVSAAEGKDAVVLFAGLPDSYESEGFDRTHLNIPEGQIELIRRVYEVNQKLVVVLCNGAPIVMPFLNETGAVLEAYLGGQAGAAAVAEILFGKANPSGKLAESFPLALEDNPSYLNFRGNGETVDYGEGIFVGYRYYEKKKTPVLFPFGYGLSYTTFEYADLVVSEKKLGEKDTLIVRVDVKNTGKRAGKEIVQLYVSENSPRVARPAKELKGFEKLELKAGEKKTAEFRLDRRAFAYWDETEHRWRVDSGKFTVMIGASSADIRLTEEVEIEADNPPKKLTIYSTFRDLRLHPNGAKAAASLLKLVGKEEKEVASDDEKDALLSFDWCILRNMTSMFGAKFTIPKLKKLLDEVNQGS